MGGDSVEPVEVAQEILDVDRRLVDAALGDLVAGEDRVALGALELGEADVEGGGEVVAEAAAEGVGLAVDVLEEGGPAGAVYANRRRRLLAYRPGCAPALERRRRLGQDIADQGAPDRAGTNLGEHAPAVFLTLDKAVLLQDREAANQGRVGHVRNRKILDQAKGVPFAAQFQLGQDFPEQVAQRTGRQGTMACAAQRPVKRQQRFPRNI